MLLFGWLQRKESRKCESENAPQMPFKCNDKFSELMCISLDLSKLEKYFSIFSLQNIVMCKSLAKPTHNACIHRVVNVHNHFWKGETFNSNCRLQQ